MWENQRTVDDHVVNVERQFLGGVAHAVVQSARPPARRDGRHRVNLLHHVHPQSKPRQRREMRNSGIAKRRNGGKKARFRGRAFPRKRVRTARFRGSAFAQRVSEEARTRTARTRACASEDARGAGSVPDVLWFVLASKPAAQCKGRLPSDTLRTSTRDSLERQMREERVFGSRASCTPGGQRYQERGSHARPHAILYGILTGSSHGRAAARSPKKRTPKSSPRTVRIPKDPRRSTRFRSSKTCAESTAAGSTFTGRVRKREEREKEREG